MDKEIFKMPTCGRIVHYFRMNCSPKENNGKFKSPAIVHNDDEYPDLHVFHTNGVSFKKTIPHKSNFIEGNEGYWEYPIIK